MDQTTFANGREYISSSSQEYTRLNFTILAPYAEPSNPPANAKSDLELHSELLVRMQSLRGRVYREYDGIASQLASDGRHHDDLDAHSWHVLLRNSDGEVLGCSRYRPVRGTFQELTVSRSALASSMRFATRLRTAVEADLGRALQQNVRYGEAGMWALAPEIRYSTAALNLALMTFALAEYLGGGLGITTATTRHASASILRRLGGRPSLQLPAYYERKYGCFIEVLFFDINALDSRHAARMRKLQTQLDHLDIITRYSRGEDDQTASALSQTKGLLSLHELLIPGQQAADLCDDVFKYQAILGETHRDSFSQP